MGEFLRYVRRNPSLGWGLSILLVLLLFSTVGQLFINKQGKPTDGTVAYAHPGPYQPGCLLC